MAKQSVTDRVTRRFLVRKVELLKKALSMLSGDQAKSLQEQIDSSTAELKWFDSHRDNKNQFGTSPRFPCYPHRVVQTPDGKLHARCEYCGGVGREEISTSSSNDHHSTSRYTKNKCRHCNGHGYEYEEVFVIQFKDFRRNEQ